MISFLYNILETEQYLSKEELQMIGEDIDKIVDMILNKMDPQSQLEYAEKYYKQKIARNESKYILLFLF